MIVGLDPGTKATGFAGADGTLFTIATGDELRGRRLEELDRKLVRALALHHPRPALVVLEGPALHAPGALSLVRQAEARGIILRRLYLEAIDVVEIPPSSLKRFATGKGNADKAAMVASAAAHGPQVLTSDEADAFHLRRLGRAAYGLEDAREAHELEVIASLTWPVLPSIQTTSTNGS